MTSLRFFLGLKSAHTGRFFVISNSEKRSERFYIWAKVSAHEPIFTPIFCLRQKIGPCALGMNILKAGDPLPDYNRFSGRRRSRWFNRMEFTPIVLARSFLSRCLAVGPWSFRSRCLAVGPWSFRSQCLAVGPWSFRSRCLAVGPCFSVTVKK